MRLPQRSLPGLQLSRPQLAGLRLADPPERWAALGFTVTGSATSVAGVELEFGLPGEGIVGWTLRDGPAAEPTPAPVHPNGVRGVDHVVLLTGDFDATAARLERDGLALSRVREVPGADRRAAHRQGFRRLGPAILEVVEARGTPGERFWGVTFIVADLEALGEYLGGRLGPPREAVQPGRRIATLRRDEAAIGCAVAFMTPEG